MDTGIARKINEKIKLLEKGRGELEAAAIEKANKMAIYDKVIAITLIELKNGVAKELAGQTIQNPPATISEKIAKGLCWKERLEADRAEALYKVTVQKMQSIQAELNGYQSIFRHLDET